MLGRLLARVAPLALASLLACARQSEPLARFPLTERVLAAVQNARPFNARVSESQRHMSCPTPGRGTTISSPFCAPLSDAVVSSLGTVAAEMARHALPNQSTDALWASALLDIVSSGQSGVALDRAMRRLAEVRVREPDLAAPLNHLAIAYIVRASARNDARDLFTALDLIEQAAERDSVSLAIAFNRALIHSLLETNRVARAEWGALASREQAAGWHDEIRRRHDALPIMRSTTVSRLSSDAIRADPELARDFVFDSILTRWATRTVAGDVAGASRIAAQADTIASALLLSSGDSSVAHLIAFCRAQDPAALATAFLRLNDGVRAYRAAAFSAAEPLLTSSIAAFHHNGFAAIADWASIYLAGVETSARDFPRAIARLNAVKIAARTRHDVALEGRALLSAGVAISRQGALDLAERDFREAMPLFSAIHEYRNQALALTWIADLQSLGGRSLEAATSAFVGYSAYAASAGAIRYEELLSVAQEMTEQGQPFAAAHLLGEATLSARQSRRAKDLPEVLGRLAVVQAALDRTDAALHTIADARKAAIPIDDALMRSRLDAELDRAEALALAPRNAGRALALIESSRTHFASIAIENAALLMEGGRLARTLGRPNLAEHMLDSAINDVRAFAVSATGQQARDLDIVLQGAQHTLFELAYSRHDTTLALRRATELWRAGHRTSLAATGNLRAGEGELRLIVTKDAVYSALRTSTGQRMVMTPIARADLRTLVGRFLNLLRIGDDSTTIRNLSRRLFDTLLLAHAPSLGGIESLTVYGDDALTALPVQLLTDESGRLLLERMAIRIAVPSVARLSPPEKLRSHGPLLIGNPTWRQADFPGLEPLRHANEEVRGVAAWYGGATLLTGVNASSDVVRRELSRHAVVHFAGHATVVPEYPGLSHLVLAAGKTFADGVLYASEIATLPLNGVDLVVLSSCGRLRDDGGVAGSVNALGNAFLDAGVGAVVAGRWEVDDDDSRILMTAMHEELSRGREISVALQRASRRLLVLPGRWARRVATVGAFAVMTRSEN
jgi:CHAT domain-containing protein/tetratricopeptide (TPR) repeat protein